VEEAVTKEFSISLSRLPSSFGYLFKKKLDVILKYLLEWLKHWLLTVRLGCEPYKDPALIHDCFSKQVSRRRRWLEKLDCEESED
jgi:hypothetical protein